MLHGKHENPTQKACHPVLGKAERVPKSGRSLRKYRLHDEPVPLKDGQSSAEVASWLSSTKDVSCASPSSLPGPGPTRAG